MEKRDQRSSSVTITIEGAPIPKGRPVFGRGRVYTPEITRKYERNVAWLAKIAMRGRAPLQGPLDVEVLFDMPIPSSWSAKLKAGARLGLIMPDVRPDLDNLIKAVLDAFNGIVFFDDAQIVRLEANKRFGTQPKTVATISLVTKGD